MTRKSVAIVAGLIVWLAASEAFGEPDTQPLHVTESVTLRADNGAEMRVPPGRYLPEPAWVALDVEMRRLQTVETRLTAENTSLRKSVADAGPGWGTAAAVVGAIAAGILGGVVLY